MIVKIFLALALSNYYCCLASYYYQTQPQLQVPYGLRYDGYQQNYQNAPDVQYYTSNHIQAPVIAPSHFTYQSPSTSYFQRTFLAPQPFYNVQASTVHLQQPSPVILQDSRPVAINNTVLSTPNTSPQMRGFIYHTNLEGGARSNVVFYSGPVPADLFQRAPQNIPASSTIHTPASDNVDTIAVDATVAVTPSPAAPVDHFQSLLALLNQQRSNDMLQLQDGILYSGVSNANRVVVNNRFLATEDTAGAEDVLPILRSSFIGKRVTTSEALVAEEPEVNASERQSKNIDIETNSEPVTTPATTTMNTATSTTVTAASSTMDVATTTVIATSTSSSTLTTPIKRMAPIVVAEMTET